MTQTKIPTVIIVNENPFSIYIISIIPRALLPVSSHVRSVQADSPQGLEQVAASARSSKIRSGKVSTQLGLTLLHVMLVGSRSSWYGCRRASTSADWDDGGGLRRVGGRDRQSWKRGSCRRMCRRICEEIEKGECISDSEKDSHGEDAGWDEHGCHAGSVG